ncbi:MAG: hypothetical protein AAFQ41_10440 [Cyanobacteria bacterium J06623_7]
MKLNCFTLRAIFCLTYSHVLAAIAWVLIPKIAIAEFVKLKEDKVTNCTHRLSSVEDISHQCQMIVDRSSPLEVWQSRLTFQFGQLSRSQFDRLQAVYGGNRTKSSLAYDSQSSYRLNDFLPPLVQAINHHRFIPETVKNRQLYLNCWGLVYEVLRGITSERSQPVIFMGQGSLMLEHLRHNSRNLLTVTEPETQIPSSLVDPGDIILVMHRSATGYEYLDHMAIAIDEGIYFEKAGTGADVPIRIVDEATLRQIWQPGVFYYEVRRLNADATLPHPKEIFSLNAPLIQQEFELGDMAVNDSHNTSIMWQEEEKDLARSSLFQIIDPLSIAWDSQGRATLAPNLYQPLLNH